MKNTFFLSALIFSLLSLTQPAWATRHSPALAPQSARASARPLTRYVVAVLRLSETRATVVREVIQAQPLLTRTPEQLLAYLRPVLLPVESARLQRLADQADTYEKLRFLSGR